MGDMEKKGCTESKKMLKNKSWVQNKMAEIAKNTDLIEY